MCRKPEPITERELKLTAAVYAKKDWIVSHVKQTGKLPAMTSGGIGGAVIGARIEVDRRGTNIELTPDEKLVYDAFIAEGRLPAGNVILLKMPEQEVRDSVGRDYPHPVCGIVVSWRLEANSFLLIEKG